MNQEYVMRNANFMHRTLQIDYLNFDKIMEEVMQQSNRCLKCKGSNFQYPDNNPRSSIHTSGDSPDFFICTGLVCWVATCLDCGAKISIYISYDYDIKRGFEVTRGDFFLDENGNYGHFSRNNIMY